MKITISSFYDVEQVTNLYEITYITDDGEVTLPTMTKEWVIKEIEKLLG